MSLLQGTPKEVVLSLIAQENALPVALTEDNLYFGNPHLDTDGVTSVLPTTAMLGGEYAGYVSFKYRRINLSQAFDDRPVLADIGAPTLLGMLPAINKTFGLNLTPDDVVDANIAYIDAGEQININVVASNKSLGYTGFFTFKFLRLRITFPAAVPNKDLPILTYPTDPALAKRSIGMMMWNHDFTEFRQDLAISFGINGANWIYLNKVKAVMAQEFGLSDWPTPAVGGVEQYLTKDYPGANTNFQYVIIQKDVVGADYAGDALFHYNTF